MVKQRIVYALVCPLSGKVRYIGNSNNAKTRYKQHCKDIGDATYKKMWIRKLAEAGRVPIFRILVIVEPGSDGREDEQRMALAHIETIYNIFLPAKNTPTVSDYRAANGIAFDCEFEAAEFKTDKYNKL